MAQVIDSDKGNNRIYVDPSIKKKKEEEEEAAAWPAAAALLGATTASAMMGNLEPVNLGGGNSRSSSSSSYSSSRGSSYYTVPGDMPVYSHNYIDPVFHDYAPDYTEYKYTPYDPLTDEDYQRVLQELGYIESSRPLYSDAYAEELAALKKEIDGRGEFTYDLYTDPAYLQARDSYIREGRRAAEDAAGRGAALTGGYGSTYSQAAAQQAYDEHLQKLNDTVPELQNAAYGRWKDRSDALLERYAQTKELSDTEYKEYRDAVSDWQKNRDYYAEQADSAYKRGLDSWNEKEDAKEKKADREYKAMMNDIETMAKYGDFSGYAFLYGEDTAENMFNAWKYSNPGAAHGMGYLSDYDYYNYR